MASKNQKELLSFLGPKYFIKTIDGEPSICLSINSRYEIEISGTKHKDTPIGVYVWDLSQGDGPHAKIVERQFDFPNRFYLKEYLETITKKYQDLI